MPACCPQTVAACGPRRIFPREAGTRRRSRNGAARSGYGRLVRERDAEVLMTKSQADRAEVVDQVEIGVRIPIVEAAWLDSDLILPTSTRTVIVFVHGSGSSRRSPRNRAVARVLREAGFGTLLLDLLTEREDQVDAVTAEYSFDIALL